MLVYKVTKVTLAENVLSEEATRCLSLGEKIRS